MPPTRCGTVTDTPNGHACRTAGRANAHITNAAMPIGYAADAAAFDLPCVSRPSATRACLPPCVQVSSPSACSCDALGPATSREVHF